MERIVSRSDLRSRSGSSSDSSASSRIADLVGETKEFEFIAPTLSQRIAQEQGKEQSQGDELEFRLFSTVNTNSTAQAQREVLKIRLDSPAIDNTSGAFIKPDRDPSYYFTQPLSPSEKKNLQSIALSGTDITTLSKLPWPGSAYPWKIFRIPITNVDKSIRAVAVPSFTKLVGSGKTRTRPGKKYRIKLRQKEAAARARKTAKVEAEAAKERSQREKRSRLNREKKLKKRARDKAKRDAGQS